LKGCLNVLAFFALVGLFFVYRETKIPLLTIVDVGRTKGSTDPITILHLADLHGDFLGRDQKYIRRLIAGRRIDLVVLTGDLVDEGTTSIEPVNSLLECLPEVPKFFVPGNHDEISPAAEELYVSLAKFGVRSLENEVATFAKNGRHISIVGIDDPYSGNPDFSLLTRHRIDRIEESEGAYKVDLSMLTAEQSQASILLCHAPTFGKRVLARLEQSQRSHQEGQVDSRQRGRGDAPQDGRQKALQDGSQAGRQYERQDGQRGMREEPTQKTPQSCPGSVLDLAWKHGFDLVLVGHTHGGQIRLPRLGALFVPGQGFPPEYVEGLYREGSTTMYITRGLGTSRLPIRLFCRPEVSIIRWFLDPGGTSTL